MTPGTGPPSRDVINCCFQKEGSWSWPLGREGGRLGTLGFWLLPCHTGGLGVTPWFSPWVCGLDLVSSYLYGVTCCARHFLMSCFTKCPQKPTSTYIFNPELQKRKSKGSKNSSDPLRESLGPGGGAPLWESRRWGTAPASARRWERGQTRTLQSADGRRAVGPEKQPCPDRENASNSKTASGRERGHTPTHDQRHVMKRSVWKGVEQHVLGQGSPESVQPRNGKNRGMYGCLCFWTALVYYYYFHPTDTM